MDKDREAWMNEDKANANLIAAAPELLEACKDLIRYLSGRNTEDWEPIDGRKGFPKNFILGEKTRHQRKAGYCKSCNKKCPESYWQIFSQSAHIAHVLLARHGVNNRAGTKKEQRFEKGVSHQMKNSGRTCSHTSSHNTKPKTAACSLTQHSSNSIFNHS